VYEVSIFDISPAQKNDLCNRLLKISGEINELQGILESGLSL